MALPVLKNRYWVLRHGRSTPNEKGLIVAHLSNGVLPQYGLSPTGFVQAKTAAELFLTEIEAEGISLQNVRIYSSPFSRTRDTAVTVAEELHLKPDVPYVQILEELRERYFGPALELESHDHYREIWALDENDPFTGPDGGESAADVANRVIKVLPVIEADCEGCAVLIVSHGDVLQILQAVIHSVEAIIISSENQDGFQQGQIENFLDRSALSQHRKYALLTGQLRQLK